MPTKPTLIVRRALKAKPLIYGILRALYGEHGYKSTYTHTTGGYQPWP